jgi:hypothetical protein
MMGNLENIMDIITTAIIAGITASITKVGEQAIVDAYNKLKELLRAKFGAKSKMVSAVKELEGNPNSEGRKITVAEEVAAAKADQDKELLQAAQAVLKATKANIGSEQITQTAKGDGNVQIVGDTNTVRVNSPRRKR